MRLRTFTAANIHDAMAQIREAMGEEAVIISTTRDPASKKVTVTAAAEDDDPVIINELSSTTVVNDSSDSYNGEAIDSTAANLLPANSKEAKIFVELKAIFAYHGVPATVTDILLETAQMINFEPDATFEGIRKALTQVIESSFQFMPLPLQRNGFRIMLIGAPGVGKTMTIAKMAAQIVMDKRDVTVISTDTKRAGGIEQLQAFTDILNIELQIAETRKELYDILQNCSGEDRVLIDSAGTNPYDASELKELGEFLGVGNVEPVLTIAAGGDAQEAAYITKAFSFANIKRMIFTRADLSRRYGSILSAACTGKYAFCNSSSSAKVIGEYRQVNASYISNLLMQYRLDE